jgi:hypothetical protein
MCERPKNIDIHFDYADGGVRVRFKHKGYIGDFIDVESLHFNSCELGALIETLKGLHEGLGGACNP